MPVPAEQSAAVEELILGPRSDRQLPRRLLLVAAIVAISLIGMLGVWRAWPRPPVPLTLGELEDAYAGMVRANGVSGTSVLTRGDHPPTPLQVSRPACLPLVENALDNHFPDAARDGVATYRLEGTRTTALFTLRFDDTAAAQSELATVAAALDECADQDFVLSSPDWPRSVKWRSTVRRTSEQAAANRFGYSLSSPDGLIVSELTSYLNTVNWQFSYAGDVTTYVPDPADDLLTGLHHQLDTVVAGRHT